MDVQSYLQERHKSLRCFRCGSEEVERLSRLRVLGATADWWRCATCSHVFTFSQASSRGTGGVSYRTRVG